MVRILTLIGLAVALAGPQAAYASSTGYGTEGPYHARHGAPLSTFQRNWNNGHESQNRARASASWVRRHGTGFPSPF
jgi:hypothetical protein